MKQHSSHLRKIGACLRHQLLNLRNENLLSTPERRCIWSAKKDLNDADMDTLTKSCCRTTVITADGEVQMYEEATVYVKELDTFLTMKVLEDTPAVLSLGKLCDEHGYSYERSTVKNHISSKTVFGYFATRRTSFRPWFLVCHRGLPPIFPLRHLWHFQGRRLIIRHLPQARLLHQPQLYHATVRLEHGKTCVGQIPIQCLCQVNMWNGKNGETRWPSQPKIKNQIEDPELERGDPFCSEIPEWLQEFREHLVDEGVPERRDSHASSSHEPSLEPTPTRSVDLGKHSVFTHFPKDRNCEICQRTQNHKCPVQKTHWRSRTSCRKYWWFD